MQEHLPLPPFFMSYVSVLLHIDAFVRFRILFESVTPLKTNEYPLKINGWKMKFPVKMVPLQGDMLIFGV